MTDNWTYIFGKGSARDTQARFNVRRLVNERNEQFHAAAPSSRERRRIVDEIINIVVVQHGGVFQRRQTDGALMNVSQLIIRRHLQTMFNGKGPPPPVIEPPPPNHPAIQQPPRAPRDAGVARLAMGEAVGRGLVPAQVQFERQDHQGVEGMLSFPAHVRSEQTPPAQHVPSDGLFGAVTDVSSGLSNGDISFIDDVNWSLDFNVLSDEEREYSQQEDEPLPFGTAGIRIPNETNPEAAMGYLPKTSGSKDDTTESEEVACGPSKKDEASAVAGEKLDRKPAASLLADEEGSTSATSLTSPSTNASSSSSSPSRVLPQAPCGFRIVLVTMVCQVCSTPFQVHVLDVNGFQCTICKRGKHQHRRTNDDSAPHDDRGTKDNPNNNNKRSDDANGDDASGQSPGRTRSHPNKSNSSNSSGERTNSACLDNTLLRLLTKASMVDDGQANHVKRDSSAARPPVTRSTAQTTTNNSLVKRESNERRQGAAEHLYSLIDERISQYLSSPITALDPVSRTSRISLVSDIVTRLKRQGGSIKIQGRDGVWRAVNDTVVQYLVAHLFWVRSRRRRTSQAPTIPLPTTFSRPLGKESPPTEIQIISLNLANGRSFVTSPGPSGGQSGVVEFQNAHEAVKKEATDASSWKPDGLQSCTSTGITGPLSKNNDSSNDFTSKLQDTHWKQFSEPSILEEVCRDAILSAKKQLLVTEHNIAPPPEIEISCQQSPNMGGSYNHPMPIPSKDHFSLSLLADTAMGEVVDSELPLDSTPPTYLTIGSTRHEQAPSQLTSCALSGDMLLLDSEATDSTKRDTTNLLLPSSVNETVSQSSNKELDSAKRQFSAMRLSETDALGETTKKLKVQHAVLVGAQEAALVPLEESGTIKLHQGDTEDGMRIPRAITGKYKTIQTLKGHSDYISCCAMWNDGRNLLSGSDDKTLKVWKRQNDGQYHCIQTVKGRSSVQCCTVWNDGRNLLSGHKAKYMKVWERKNDGQYQCTQTLQGHSNTVWCCAVWNDRRHLLSGSSDKSLKVWERQSDGQYQCMQTLQGHSNKVYCCAAWNDGSHLLSGSRDKTLKVWGRQSDGQYQCIQTLQGHFSVVTCCAVWNDGRHLLSGSWANTLKVWERQSDGQYQCIQTLQGHSMAVECCAVWNDGRHLLSGSEDKTLKVWERQSDGQYQCIQTLQGHSNWVNSCAVSDNGQLLVSGSEDKTLKVWKLEADEADEEDNHTSGDGSYQQFAEG